VEVTQNEQTNTRTIRIYFDGGYNVQRGAACAAYISKTIYTSRKITGHASSHSAEANGALDALRLALKMIRECPDITHIIILGDNHDCVMTLATQTESLRAVPGRSNCPGTWKNIQEAREELNAHLRATNKTLDLDWQWIPRKYNAFADHLCTACLRDTAPTFQGCEDIEPPTVYDKPNHTTLTAITKRLIAGELPSSWRSIPPALRVSWHTAISRVCAWDDPWALLLAPAVLLQRHGELPARRLQRLATQPMMIEMYYWHAAFGDTVKDVKHSNVDMGAAPRRTATEQEIPVAMIERLAAHSPARALKLLTGAPPSDPENDLVKRSVGRRFTATSEPIPGTEPCKKPAWINREVIIKVVATRLARAAAPGCDGWTRELLIASFCKPSLALFESLINSIANNDAPPFAADLLRSARIAAWRKDPKAWDQRVIGMTSAITKIAWKILTAQHLSNHNVARNIATYTKGGAIGVIRWAESAYKDNKPVFLADVVDAYWTVDRPKLMSHLVGTNSPLAFLFALVYGFPAQCRFGKTMYQSKAGVIPGCGGGSILFALETHRLTLPSFHDPAVSAIYADDITTIGADAYRTACDVFAGKGLAKLRILAKNRSLVPAGMRNDISPAIRLLGGYIGDPAAAADLFAVDVKERLAQVSTVQHSSLSSQTKWALLKTINLGLKWKFAATHPDITRQHTQTVDEALAKAVFSLATGDPTHKSRTLLYTPIASGGMGLLSYALHAECAYNAATAKAIWPPEGLKEEEKGIIERALTPKQILRDLEEKQNAIAQEQLGFFELKTRTSKTTPFFDTPALTRKLRITDEAFNLALGNFLRCDTTYDVCSHRKPEQPTSDHAQVCHKCGGPYRYARHNIVIAAFRSVCQEYGISTTENFFGTFGVTDRRQRPDIIVFRPATNQQPLVLDFSIAHQSQEHAKVMDSVNARWNAKAKKYANWMRGDVEFSPFIIGSNTVPHEQTTAIIEALQAQAIRKGFARDCVARMKIALVNFEPYRKRAITTRKQSGSLDYEVGMNEDSDDAG